MLTIGYGLVAQIPSLLLSTAAAIMVTRVNSSQDMGKQVISQLFGSPKALAVAAAILFIMGSIPGMPHVAFLSLAIVAGIGAYFIQQRNLAAEASSEQESAAQVKQPEPEIGRAHV